MILLSYTFASAPLKKHLCVFLIIHYISRQIQSNQQTNPAQPSPVQKNREPEGLPLV